MQKSMKGSMIMLTLEKLRKLKTLFARNGISLIVALAFILTGSISLFVALANTPVTADDVIPSTKQILSGMTIYGFTGGTCDSQIINGSKNATNDSTHDYKWESTSSNAYLTLDLGSSTDVSYIRLLNRSINGATSRFPKDFKVYVSEAAPTYSADHSICTMPANETIDYTGAFSSYPNSGQYWQGVSFPKATGRYVTLCVTSTFSTDNTVDICGISLGKELSYYPTTNMQVIGTTSRMWWDPAGVLKPDTTGNSGWHTTSMADTGNPKYLTIDLGDYLSIQSFGALSRAVYGSGTFIKNFKLYLSYAAPTYIQQSTGANNAATYSISGLSENDKIFDGSTASQPQAAAIWEDVLVNAVGKSGRYLTIYVTSTYGGDNSVISGIRLLAELSKPPAPKNLTTTAISSTNVSLKWDSLDNVVYDVYKDGFKINTSDITTNNYRVFGLDPETSYTFTVTARIKSGIVSDNSNTLNVTTIPVQNYSLTAGTEYSNTFGDFLTINLHRGNEILSNGKIVIKYTFSDGTVGLVTTSISDSFSITKPNGKIISVTAFIVDVTISGNVYKCTINKE
jgi:hypothetical protein